MASTKHTDSPAAEAKAWAEDRNATAKELAERLLKDTDGDSQQEREKLEFELRALPRLWAVRLDGVFLGSVDAVDIQSAIEVACVEHGLQPCAVNDLVQTLDVRCRDEIGSTAVERSDT